MFYEVSLNLEINFHLGYSLIHQERHQRNSVIAVFNSVIVVIVVLKWKSKTKTGQSNEPIKARRTSLHAAVAKRGKRVQTSHFWVVLTSDWITKWREFLSQSCSEKSSMRHIRKDHVVHCFHFISNSTCSYSKWQCSSSRCKFTKMIKGKTGFNLFSHVYFLISSLVTS